MANNKIEWTNKTWNVITGCSKVSTGCKNCYAEIMHKRLQAMGLPKYKEGFEFVRFHTDALEIPFKTKKPTMFFVNSMSDLFHNKILSLEANANLSFITKLFNVIRKCPQHTFQILTKRPVNALVYIYYNDIPPNVWLGTTVEHSSTKCRIETLRKCNASVRFLSCEPLLSALPDLDLEGIDWVIVGAESGHGRREMMTEWAIDIAEQCKRAGVAFFMKQMFEGKRKLKFEEFPEELRIREFPNR